MSVPGANPALIVGKGLNQESGAAGVAVAADVAAAVEAVAVRVRSEQPVPAAAAVAAAGVEAVDAGHAADAGSLFVPITPQSCGPLTSVKLADEADGVAGEDVAHRGRDAVDVDGAAVDRVAVDLAAEVTRCNHGVLDQDRGRVDATPESIAAHIGPMVSPPVPQLTPKPLEQWPAVIVQRVLLRRGR